MRLALRPGVPLAACVRRSVRGLKSTPYSEVTIGVPKELAPLERRVAQTPETVTKLVKEGFKVNVEKGAGALASFNDDAYVKAGATMVDRKTAFAASFVTKITAPTTEEAKMVGDRTLLSFLWPAQNPDLIKQLQEQKATAFAMDCIPRTLSSARTSPHP